MGMQISFELTDRDLNFFRKALRQSRAAVQHAEDAEIIEEIPEEQKGAVCLLTGNNLVMGRLADGTLNVVSGTTITPLETREILTMARSFDNDSEILPVFEIELNQGDILLGTLREDTVTVESKHANWSVPVQQFMSLQVPVEDD